MSGGGDSGSFYGYTGTDYSHIPVSGSYSTLDFPSSFKPTPQPDAQFKEAWDYDEQKLSDPTWDIENIRLAIKGQKPGSMSAMADYWQNVVTLLHTVQQTVAQQADALHGGNKNGFGGWTSPAADEFLRWGPGGSLYSLNQWAEAAQKNVTALRQMAADVNQAHKDIDDAWNGYLTESNTAQTNLKNSYQFPTDPATMSSDQVKQMGPAVNEYLRKSYEYQTAIWRKWSVKAQHIAYDLSQKYYTQLDTMAEGRGTRFEGPANAVVDMPMPGNAAPSPPPSSAPPPGATPPPSAAPPPGSAPPPPGTNGPLPASAPPGAPPPGMPDPTSAPAPAPLSPEMVPVPVAGPGTLNISPLTAQLVGLPMLTAATKMSLAGPGGPCLSATLTKCGVLRPAAGQFQAPPGGMGRGTLSRATGAGGEPGASPMRPNRRGVLSRDTNRSGTPAVDDEEPFGRGSVGAPGTTRPVLGGRSFSGRGPNLGGTSEPPPGQGTPTRPGTNPSVLRRDKSDKDQRRPGTPVEEEFGASEPTQPGTSAPVLSNRMARDQRSDGRHSHEGAPGALRGVHASGASADQTGGSELSSRRHWQPDQPVDARAAPTEDHPKVITDEDAFVVETPGGAVLTSRTEQPVYEPEYRPTLGSGA